MTIEGSGKITNDQAAEAIRDSLISPNECDQNMENANVVDGLFAIARSIERLAKAVESIGYNGIPG